MAKQNEYFEIIVEGTHEVVRAFIRGYLAATDEEDDVIFHRDHNIERTPFSEKIAEWLLWKEHQSHFVAPGDLVEDLCKAVSANQKELKIQFHSKRRVLDAWFSFSFEVFSQKYADNVMRIFKNLPPGVTLEGYSTELQEHPEAKGVELYAPMHEYELSGAGKAVGDLAAILELYSAVKKEPLISIEEIQLTFE